MRKWRGELTQSESTLCCVVRLCAGTLCLRLGWEWAGGSVVRWMVRTSLRMRCANCSEETRCSVAHSGQREVEQLTGYRMSLASPVALSASQSCSGGQAAYGSVEGDSNERVGGREAGDCGRRERARSTAGVMERATLEADTGCTKCVMGGGRQKEDDMCTLWRCASRTSIQGPRGYDPSPVPVGVGRHTS